MTFKVLRNRVESLWRYREVLPVVNDEWIVSLGEGWTPLSRMHQSGNILGHDGVYVKDESVNPTGSFKARGLSTAVSRAKELGITSIAMPSAGNAGGALAAYCARAGVEAHVFVPEDTPSANIDEVGLFGGNIHLVPGVISDAARVMNQFRKNEPWFDMSTMKEPYRLEGKKTMGYELAEQFEWSLPDVIVYPTGGGTGLIGMWKAFLEMRSMGWIEGEFPRMVAVQAEGCSPIIKAWKNGNSVSEFWDGASTIASGLRVPKAFADEMILDILKSSNGTALSVTDDEILVMMKRVATHAGLFLCPEGAATAAAIPHLAAAGFLRETDRVVIFNTGSGYKYAEVLKKLRV